jgi:hypothetical protein
MIKKHTQGPNDMTGIIWASQVSLFVAMVLLSKGKNLKLMTKWLVS